MATAGDGKLCAGLMNRQAARLVLEAAGPHRAAAPRPCNSAGHVKAGSLSGSGPP